MRGERRPPPIGRPAKWRSCWHHEPNPPPTRPETAISVDNATSTEPSPSNRVDGEWIWEGAAQPEIVAVGHSHRQALLASLRSAQFQPSVPAAVLIGTTLAWGAPDEMYWNLACTPPDGATVAIIFSGNQHDINFLFMPPPKFTVWTRAARDGLVVPVEMLRSFFEPTLRELNYVLRRMAESGTASLVAGTPPPKRDPFVLDWLIAKQGFDAEMVKTVQLTPGPLRVAIWEVLQEMFAETAASHGVAFCPVPEEARDADGFLRDDLAAPDATHANHVYGQLMWHELARAATPPELVHA